MATRLPDPLLTATLPRLPGWSRDEDRIRREFRVDGATRGRVAADLDAMARRLHHPIRVTGTPDGVAIALTTVEVHGVSEIDVALATRINALFGAAPPANVPQRVTGVGKVVAGVQPGDGDEHAWWGDSDADEPVMGVPSALAGVMPAPLPDTAPDEAQPGVELEQESGAGRGLGFSFRGAGDADR